MITVTEMRQLFTSLISMDGMWIGNFHYVPVDRVLKLLATYAEQQDGSFPEVTFEGKMAHLTWRVPNDKVDR